MKDQISNLFKKSKHKLFMLVIRFAKTVVPSDMFKAAAIKSAAQRTGHKATRVKSDGKGVVVTMDKKVVMSSENIEFCSITGVTFSGRNIRIATSNGAEAEFIVQHIQQS